MTFPSFPPDRVAKWMHDWFSKDDKEHPLDKEIEKAYYEGDR